MSQLTWEAMNPIDTSRYLDAIQKAQAQSVAGVEQIGNAYRGYQDNLKKQNTNDMLTALNQAQNPEQLAAAQANIAAMQQRWGSGYDMDTVRTAMDERPAVLMQRQSTEMDFKDKQANVAARPQVAAIYGKQLAALGATPEELAQIQAIADTGVDTTDISTKAGQYLTDARNFANKDYWDLKKFNQGAYEFGANLNQRKNEFNQTHNLAAVKSAWEMGKGAYEADLASGAGTTYVAADGTEYTTGGSGGGASIANYASKFMPTGVRQAIFKGESQGDYDTLYGNSQRAGGRFAGVKLTSMTVNEALEFSKAGGEYARWSKTQKGVEPGTYATPMGAYQVVGTTLQKAAKALGLKGDEKMTPELQDKIGDYIYQTQGTNAWEGYRGPVQGGGGYKPGNAVSNTPAAAPLVGIDRKVQQKIRGDYQNAMLKYNEDLALKDQPINVGNVLAGLTAKEKGSTRKQDAFDIVNALKDNPQLQGLSAEGITNVYNRAKAWQAKPGVPLIGYNSSNGLKKSIDNIIKDEIGIDAKRKQHVAKASHPSNLYAQQIQQAFEEKGVSISAKEALLHIDPARYQSLYGKPTVKVQEAVDKKVDKAAATATPAAKTYQASTATAVAAAAKPKPVPQAKSQAFIPFAKPVTTMKPNASSTTTKPTPQTSTPKAETKVAKPSKQDVVAFYVKRGEVGNVVPNGINSRTDRQLIREAQAEATKQLAAKEAKQKADAAVKKAAAKAEAAKVRKEYAEHQKERIANQRLKAAQNTPTKSADINQLRKAYAEQQALSLSNAARKAKEEEERKRKNK